MPDNNTHLLDELMKRALPTKTGVNNLVGFNLFSEPPPPPREPWQLQTTPDGLKSVKQRNTDAEQRKNEKNEKKGQ